MLAASSLLSLLACQDPGDPADPLATSLKTGDGQQVAIVETDFGTLHASWKCIPGGALTLSADGGEVRELAPPEDAGEGCVREVEISAPGRDAVEITLVSAEDPDEVDAVSCPMPEPPDGVFEVERGLTLETEDGSGAMVDDGVLVLGYEFYSESDLPGWGSGVALILDRFGRHLAHIWTEADAERIHKSVFLDAASGVLSATDYKRDLSESGMESNQIVRLAMGGVAPRDQRQVIPTSQAHHFHHNAGGGELLYMDVERICDFSGSGKTLALDRVYQFDPATNERSLLINSGDEWVPAMLERLGLQEMLSVGSGNYDVETCGGVVQQVSDVTHFNGIDCPIDAEECLVSSLGSINTVLVFERESGALLQDLSTYPRVFIDDEAAGIPPIELDEMPEQHDIRRIGDDRYIVFVNGNPATGGAPSLFEFTAPEGETPGELRELWTNRREEDCIQSLAMGWVSPLDVEGAPLMEFFAEYEPGDDLGGWGETRMLVSYGTGGIFTVEDASGERLAQMYFSDVDYSPNACGQYDFRAPIYAGEIHHYSEATLEASFPDWIILE